MGMFDKNFLGLSGSRLNVKTMSDDEALQNPAFASGRARSRVLAIAFVVYVIGSLFLIPILTGKGIYSIFDDGYSAVQAMAIAVAGWVFLYDGHYNMSTFICALEGLFRFYTLYLLAAENEVGFLDVAAANPPLAILLLGGSIFCFILAMSVQLDPNIRCFGDKMRSFSERVNEDKEERRAGRRL